jgi:hypothetical protein
MTWTIGLGIAACGASGIALWLAQRVWSLRGERNRLEAENSMLHRRLGASEDAHKSLCEQVAETAAVYVEVAPRYGLDLASWPAIQALVEQSPYRAAWWLLSHAPGFRGLSSGQVATDRFHPTFNGWRPPRLPEGQ